MRTNMLKRDPVTPGTCEWCGSPCEVEDSACSLSCEAQLRRLESRQGTLVLRKLKVWRKNRGRKGTPGEGMMTEVASIIDGFLKSDRLRRERTQQEKRLKEQQAAEEAAKPKGKPGPKPKPKMETAAPVVDQPDPDAPEAPE